MKIDNENVSVAKELSQIRQQLVKITTLLTGILVTVIILCGVALVPIFTSDFEIGVSTLIFGIYILAMFVGGITGLAAAVINRRTAMSRQEERMTALLVEVENAASATGGERVSN